MRHRFLESLFIFLYTVSLWAAFATWGVVFFPFLFVAALLELLRPASGVLS